MKPIRIAYTTCPRCHALNEHGMAECCLCEMRLAGLPADVLPVGSRRRFRLATLMLLIALVAAFLGLLRAVPVLAALLAVPGVIALALTCVWSGQRYGRPPTNEQHVRAFALIFGLMIAIMASSVIAFCTTCATILALKSASGSDFQAESAAAVFGMIAAIVVPVALLYAARVRGTRFRNRPPSGRRD